MRIYTINEISQNLGIPYITTYKIMKRLSVGRKMGRDWILTDDDFEKIRLHSKKGIQIA